MERWRSAGSGLRAAACRVAGAAALLLAGGMAAAAPVSPWVGAEAGTFQWQEFLDGDRELRESGPALRFGTGVDNLDAAERGPLLHGAFWINLARVDYDGSAQYLDEDGQRQTVPAETDGQYQGVSALFLMGRRWRPRGPSGMGVDLLGGFGFDHWRRRLEDTSIADGRPVAGITEYYYLLDLQLAAGTVHRPAGWGVRWHAGFRYPFYVSEYFENSVNLNPRGVWSPFAEVTVVPPGAGRGPAGGGWALTLRYDTYRFEASDTAPAGGYFLFQPESDMDRITVGTRYRFQ